MLANILMTWHKLRPLHQLWFKKCSFHDMLILSENQFQKGSVDWSKSNVIKVALDGSTTLVEDNSCFLCVEKYCNISMEDATHCAWGISWTTFSLWVDCALGVCIILRRTPFGGCTTMSMVGFSMGRKPLSHDFDWSNVLMALSMFL